MRSVHVFRKPLVCATVVDQVLSSGTGSLNIGACRIAAPDDQMPSPTRAPGWDSINRSNAAAGYRPSDYVRGDAQYVPDAAGRWPANLVLSGLGSVMGAFPVVASGAGTVKRESASGRSGNVSSTYGAESRPAGQVQVAYGDSGSAARFFKVVPVVSRWVQPPLVTSPDCGVAQMSKNLTAQDRSALIKLAASMAPGSEERRAILAGLGGPADLFSVMESLDQLAELDEALSAVTESVQGHFRIASEIHSEVSSHSNALQKAKQGLELAQGVLHNATNIAHMFPDDKTAQRAQADATTMVKRFTKHVEDTQKILRTIAQKQIPPALKEAATKVKTAVTKLLVDPSKMEITYEVVPVSNYNYAMDRHIHSVSFRVYYFIKTDKPRGFKMVLSESAVGAKGVKIGGEYTDSSVLYTGPDQAVTMVRDALKGWSGLVGESDASNERSKLSITLATLLDALVFRSGFGGSNNSTVSNRGAVVENHFYYGPGLPRDGAYEVGAHAYEHMVRVAIANWRKVLDPALAPYQSSIQKVHVSVEDKGLVRTMITLK